MFLDENIPIAVAQGLRIRNFDVLTCKEVGTLSKSDIQQLRFATEADRCIVTLDISDFCKLHADFMQQGLSHKGIILSKESSIGLTVKALIQVVLTMSPKQMENNIVWLSDYTRNISKS